jgi:hypothetical protein
MTMTDTLPRRATLLTIPALEGASLTTAPRDADTASLAEAPLSDGTTASFFYLILSFIVAALVIGIFAA